MLSILVPVYNAEQYLNKLSPLARNNKVWANRLQVIRNMLRSSGSPGKAE